MVKLVKIWGAQPVHHPVHGRCTVIYDVWPYDLYMWIGKPGEPQVRVLVEDVEVL